MEVRIVFGYRCPECAEKFRWPQHASPPERCPLCKAWVSEEEPGEFVPKAPAIRKSPYTKSVDQTYRAMEQASIERAREAASALGVSEAEVSNLKLTNMKDPSQMREGETAAILPSVDPAVAKGAGFQTLGGKPPDYQPGVGGGRGPLDAVRNAMTSNHRTRAGAMIRAGNIGSYRE
jgi:hypothetical protein